MTKYLVFGHGLLGTFCKDLPDVKVLPQIFCFQIWDAETTPMTLIHEQVNITFFNTCAYIKIVVMGFVGPDLAYAFFDNMNFYYLSG